MTGFTSSLSAALSAADNARAEREGRAAQRRLNRYEYENVVRDLFHAPWLQIRDSLPEDGEADRFNKIGDALDVSHVQMARYLSVADGALRDVAATYGHRIPTTTVRYYARDQRSFTGKMKFDVFNTRPERATFPVLGTQRPARCANGQGRRSATPRTCARRSRGRRRQHLRAARNHFQSLQSPASGHYHTSLQDLHGLGRPREGKSAGTFPTLIIFRQGRRFEPVTIYSETPPRLLRRLGSFDAQTEPAVQEIDIYLLAGETIWPDAARLFARARQAGSIPWPRKTAARRGVRWMEVEGPALRSKAATSQQLLFGDLPLKAVETAPRAPCGARSTGDFEKSAREDAEQLLRNFLSHSLSRAVQRRMMLPVS